MSYYGDMLEAALHQQGLGPDGQPLQGDPDIHGGHPDLPKEDPKPRDPQAQSVEPADGEAIEGGYPLP